MSNEDFIFNFIFIHFLESITKKIFYLNLNSPKNRNSKEKKCDK